MKSVFSVNFFTDLCRKMTRESEFAVVIWIRLYFKGEIDEIFDEIDFLNMFVV